MTAKFETFRALHVPGNPAVLYNIWDVGSAHAVVKAGAKALATGSIRWPMPTAGPTGSRCRSISRWPMPSASLTRLSAGDGRLRGRLLGRSRGRRRECGAVGGNRRGRLQFRGPGGRREGLYPLDSSEADRRDPPRDRRAILHQRPHRYLLEDAERDDALVDQAVERGKAFADAGASGISSPPGRSRADRTRSCAKSLAPKRHRFSGRPRQEPWAAQAWRASATVPSPTAR